MPIKGGSMPPETRKKISEMMKKQYKNGRRAPTYWLGKTGENTPRWKDGRTKTRFYRIWQGIKNRVKNKGCSAFSYYGARGIKVCERWQKFENFRDDMYESYLAHAKEHGEKNTTIDRIDNNGNYEKSNCKWVTRKEQVNNTRHNRFLTFQQKTKTISEWGRELNINPETLRSRLRYGWTEEETLTGKRKKLQKSFSL